MLNLDCSVSLAKGGSGAEAWMIVTLNLPPPTFIRLSTTCILIRPTSFLSRDLFITRLKQTREAEKDYITNLAFNFPNNDIRRRHQPGNIQESSQTLRIPSKCHSCSRQLLHHPQNTPPYPKKEPKESGSKIAGNCTSTATPHISPHQIWNWPVFYPSDKHLIQVQY